VTLLLDNDDVRRVLRMDECIVALDEAFRDHAAGRAVNRPRSHTYTDLGEGTHYLLKTMDGSLPRAGVHALRVTSDLTFEHDGRRDKLPAAPGERFVGLVMLFDLEELVPLAIVHDGYLQRMRVGATSALAASHLARPDATVAGVIGAGWQAGAQIEGLRAVRELDEIRVFAPTRERLETFCAEYGATPAASARHAVESADIVALATNAQRPVLDARWVAPGTHVNSVQRHEVDAELLARAELVVVRSRDEPGFHYAPGHRPRASLQPQLSDDVVELGEVLTGAEGRRTSKGLTLFMGGGGLGIQFAAVGNLVYERARAEGLGRELPTDWFTQKEKP
jgi:alanine dehydrogenase